MKTNLEELTPLLESGLVTSSEAARLKGVSRAAINYLIRAGRIKPVRLFGRVLVNRDEVLKYKHAKSGRPSKQSDTKKVSAKRSKKGGTKK